MKILFIHQNFPGQFKHIAAAAKAEGLEIRVLRIAQPTGQQNSTIDYYKVERGNTPGQHPWLLDLESKMIRAHAAGRKMQEMAHAGYEPDVIFAHHGWGEPLLAKDVWPKAKLALYCEYFYSYDNGEMTFDPEFPASDILETKARLRVKNLNNLLHMALADAAISPTHWQANTFPSPFRTNIFVCHDGIDTDLLSPKPGAEVAITRGNLKIKLRLGDDVVTFVNRNLEPYRGYHSFVRAIPQILARSSTTQILIVGGDSVSYGAPPDKEKYGGQTWKTIFWQEIASSLTEEQSSRVHFLGWVNYETFLSVLAVSKVHVYLSYPFVLSWSLLEAMSMGAGIVASRTDPILEVISDGSNGRIVDFLSPSEIASTILELISDKHQRERLGGEARRTIVGNYDLKRICLPRQLTWLTEICP